MAEPFDAALVEGLLVAVEVKDVAVGVLGRGIEYPFVHPPHRDRSDEDGDGVESVLELMLLLSYCIRIYSDGDVTPLSPHVAGPRRGGVSQATPHHW